MAIWFAIMLPLLAFGALVTVDFARASTAKQTLQEAVDAAALIAARSTANTSDAVDAVGDAALAGMLTGNTSITGLTANGSGRIAGVTFTLSGSTISVNATAGVTPLISAGFIGASIPIHASSTVARSINRLEIALVLDTTGSMQGTKITNLKTAAKNFITSMETAAANSGMSEAVKISVVPFSTTVRVQDPLSMASYNTTTFAMTGLPTWLDGRARSTPWNKDIFTISSSSSARYDRFAMLKAIGRSWGGCVEARAAPYDIRDTAPSSGNVNTLFTPWFWPDEPDDHADYQNDYLNDKAGSNWSTRQGNPGKYDTTTFKVSGTWIPASGYGAAWDYGPNAACNMQKIMRLSTNYSALRTHIDGLVPSGETNIPLGLAWGWHSISPNAPFSDGVAYNTAGVTKVIILMTDGDNTMNDALGYYNMNNSYYHGYGFAWQGRLNGLSASDTSGQRTARLNERMVSSSGQEALCSNIKNQGVELYTVGVGVSSGARSLLETCATATDNYYDVGSDGSGLVSAFAAIAGRIQSLRITR